MWHLHVALLSALLVTSGMSCGNHDHHHDHEHDHTEEQRQLQLRGQPFWVGNFKYDSFEEFKGSGHRCGFKDPSPEEEQRFKETVLAWVKEKKEKEKKSGRLLQSTQSFCPVTIPAHFHVIRAEGTGPGTVEPQESIDVLNAAFADQGFQFELATETLTFNTAWYFSSQDSSSGSDEATMKAALRVGGPGDLNVWLTDGAGLLGWATLPGPNAGRSYDGVVLASETVPGGTLAPYNEGDTLVHETGHWLGLRHTFEGGCSGGDGVDDTPAEAEPAYGCPVGRDSCPAPGVDPITNYMDYSDDSCLNNFSPGQAIRMQALYCEYRAEGACEITCSPTIPPNSDAPSMVPTMTSTEAGAPTNGPTPAGTEPSQSPSVQTSSLPSTSQPSDTNTKPPTSSPSTSPSNTPTIPPTEVAQCGLIRDSCSSNADCCSSLRCKRGFCHGSKPKSSKPSGRSNSSTSKSSNRSNSSRSKKSGRRKKSGRNKKSD